MKTRIITILLFVLTFSNALERGRDYMQRKICHDFNTTGSDNFRSAAIVLNGRKYSNATFEEVISIANEIVALAQKCCPEGAEPDCYEMESLALSVKSCNENNPFPKHPGTAACCTEQGLARKLCLAALKHPPKEFPTYVEPSSDDVCEDFARNPRDFADRFLYEYSSDYSQAPFPVLLASASSYLSLVLKCCPSQQPTDCLMKEKLLRKPISTITFLANKACSRYAVFGKEKTKLSYLITYTQKSPNASLEDITSLAESASEILSKSCDSISYEHCIEREGAEHTAEICTKLAAHDERIRECCQNNCTMTKYLCLYFLPWAKSPQLPSFEKPSDEALCSERKEQELIRYVYEITRRHTRVPEGLLNLIHKNCQTLVDTCCTAEDSKSCFAAERPKLRATINDLLTKGSELCSHYTDLTFVQFKKWLRQYFVKTLPDAIEDAISGRVEQRANFASTCCLPNAPSSYCGQKVYDELTTDTL